jgi:hypothetical protein
MDKKQKLDKSTSQMLFVISAGVLLSFILFKLAFPAILNLSNSKFRIPSNNLLTNNASGPLPQITRRAVFSPGESIWITPASRAGLKDCTYTDIYWQRRPEAWMTENILVGKYAFSKEQILAILISSSQDHSVLLQKQFMTAILNISNGSDPSAIELVLADAADWMSAHPPRIILSETSYQRELNLTRLLSEYNNGVSGPGLCPDNPSTSTPHASLIPTSTPTHSLAIQAPNTPNVALPEHRSILSSPLAPSTPTPVVPAPPIPTPVQTTAPTTPVVVQTTAAPTPVVVQPTDTPAPTSPAVIQPTEPPVPPTSAVTEPVITQAPTEGVNPTEPPQPPPPTENPQPTDPAETPPGHEPKPTKEPRPTKEPKPTESVQTPAPAIQRGWAPTL